MSPLPFNLLKKPKPWPPKEYCRWGKKIHLEIQLIFPSLFMYRLQANKENRIKKRSLKERGCATPSGGWKQMPFATRFSVASNRQFRSITRKGVSSKSLREQHSVEGSRADSKLIFEEQVKPQQSWALGKPRTALSICPRSCAWGSAALACTSPSLLSPQPAHWPGREEALLGAPAAKAVWERRCLTITAPAEEVVLLTDAYTWRFSK